MFTRMLSTKTSITVLSLGKPEAASGALERLATVRTTRGYCTPGPEGGKALRLVARDDRVTRLAGQFVSMAGRDLRRWCAASTRPVPRRRALLAPACPPSCSERARRPAALRS